MLQSEMPIQEVVKACARFVSTDGTHLLHACFDNITEYDPDVAFDIKKRSAFFSKCCFFMQPTYIHTLGAHSPSPPPPSCQAWCWRTV